MVDANFLNLNICDSLEELNEIREIQSIIRQSVTALKTDRTDSDTVRYTIASLNREAQDLEYDAAEIESTIVQAFVNLQKRVAQLEEQLKNAQGQQKNPPIWSGWSL